MIELPSSQAVAFALLWMLAGMAVPTEFGIRRLNGFGRWMFNKLPSAPEEIEQQPATKSEQNHE